MTILERKQGFHTLILPYKVSCDRVSLEIPLLSLAYLSTPDMQFHFTTEEEELLTPVCMQ